MDNLPLSIGSFFRWAGMILSGLSETVNGRKADLKWEGKMFGRDVGAYAATFSH
jgi:hypothetical protein